MATPVKIIHNVTANTWHPILYRESPLPGGASSPMRFKSMGHHTLGFKTRQEAIDEVNSEDFRKRVTQIGSYPIYLTREYIEWDGNGLPADTFFISPSELAPPNNLAS